MFKYIFALSVFVFIMAALPVFGVMPEDGSPMPPAKPGTVRAQ